VEGISSQKHMETIETLTKELKEKDNRVHDVVYDIEQLQREVNKVKNTDAEL